MSEAGDFELFSGPAPKEFDEKSDEQFREEMRKSQQAQQQLQKEEGHAKANDDRLAQIIVQFLAQPGNEDLFLLISRCVAQNIPSELIIAVLSLVDRKAYEEMDTILKGAEKRALLVPEHQEMRALTPGQRKQIDEWIQNITVAAANKPHRTLESVVIKQTAKNSQDVIREIAPAFVQLSAFILRNHLAMQSTQIEYQKLRDFMESVYAKMIAELEEMVQGQRLLGDKKST